MKKRSIFILWVIVLPALLVAAACNNYWAGRALIPGNITAAQYQALRSDKFPPQLHEGVGVVTPDGLIAVTCDNDIGTTFIVSPTECRAQLTSSVKTSEDSSIGGGLGIIDIATFRLRAKRNRTWQPIYDQLCNATAQLDLVSRTVCQLSYDLPCDKVAYAARTELRTHYLNLAEETIKYSYKVAGITSRSYKKTGRAQPNNYEEEDDDDDEIPPDIDQDQVTEAEKAYNDTVGKVRTPSRTATILMEGLEKAGTIARWISGLVQDSRAREKRGSESDAGPPDGGSK